MTEINNLNMQIQEQRQNYERIILSLRDEKATYEEL